jgi:hypothetical protein
MTMNKKILFVALFFAAALQTHAQSRRIDSVAVSILDHMSSMIGELGSCSLTVKSNYDIVSRDLGLVKHTDDEQLYLHGPNKLLVRAEGDKGTRYLSYNGKTLTYFSLDKNQYGQIESSSPIMDMIDTVNKLYGIEFPAADFFYPSFVDDILADATNLIYLGITKADGKDCFHIAGTGKDKTFQFWICDDAFYLPVKMVIVNTANPSKPQFEAVLTDWKVNPDLPDALFEFSAPPRAKKIKMVALSDKK